MTGRPSAADPRRLTQDLVDQVWNAGDPAAFRAFSDDRLAVDDWRYANDHARTEELVAGLDRILKVCKQLNTRVLWSVCEDDAIAWAYEMTGLWQRPTGPPQPFRVRGVTWFAFDGGRLTKRFGVMDVPGLAYQVGEVTRHIRLTMPV